MFAVRSTIRLGSRFFGPAVARRGCAGAAVPVDDVVNGLTEDQIQVSYTLPSSAAVTKFTHEAGGKTSTKSVSPLLLPAAVFPELQG